MKIHRIVLRDFAGVEHSELEPAESGVTVVVGPNESGKSSLLTAVELLFEFKDSSKHQRVREVKPTHRDAGPFVEVEMSAGPYRFTYAKRWLKSPVTELSIHAPQRAQFTGQDAHERVDRMLAETVDDDLWRALRQAQGHSLDQADLAVVGSLHRALGEVADDAAVGEHDDLLAAVRAERDRYYTETGRERKALEEPRSALEAARDDAEAARTVLTAIARTLDRHRDLGHELEVARASLVEQRAERDRLRAARRDVDALIRTVQDATHEHRARQTERLRLHERVAERARLVEQHDRRDAARTAAGAARDAAASAAQQAEARLRAEDDAVKEAEAAQVELTSRRDALKRIAEARRDLDEVQRVAGRLETIDATTAELARLEQALEENRLGEEALRELLDAHATAESLSSQARSEAPVVTVERLGSAAVTVDGGPLEARQFDTRALRDVTVEVSDVVRVTVNPDHDSRRRAQAAEAARDDLRRRLDEHGVADIGQARDRRAERARLEDRRRDRLAERAAALGHDTREQLAARRDAASRRAEAAQAGSAHDDPADLESVEQALQEATDALQEARRVQDRARAARTSADSAAVEARVNAESADREYDDVRILLEAAREQESDDAVHVALAEAEDAFERSAEVLAAAEAARDERDVATLEERVEYAASAVESTAARITALEADVHGLAGELRAREAEGWHDRLLDAEGRAADLERLLDRRLARAAAARLLDDTLQTHRRAAQSRYVAPFAREFESLARIVFGDDASVQVSDDLRIAARTLDGVTVPFDSLSGGAREQLALLGRLATARLVDADGGAPLIIDDALGFSDAERRRRIAALLSLVGKQAQIIVLTCEPERYRDVVRAHTHRL